MNERTSVWSWAMVALPYVLLVLMWVVLLRQVRRGVVPTPETPEATKVFLDRRWLTSGWVAVVFMVVYLGVFLVRGLVTMAPLMRTALVWVPVAAFAWFIVAFVRELRSGDELEKQVLLEACAFAFMMVLMGSMWMWVSDQLVPTDRRGMLDTGLWFLPMFYSIGMFLAKAKFIPTARKDR